MATVATITPLNQFFDTNGSPLNSGYIYFGLPDQDPEQFPAQMFWDLAGTVPALQPIRTISGYPSRGGSPAIIYGPESYSLRVKNSALVQVLYAPNIGGIPSSSSLASSSGTSLIGGTWFGGVIATVATLATSAGSSLLGFIQAGAGAVSRSVQSRLRDTIHVKDFGAVGDGITNDTAAIAAAITYAKTLTCPHLIVDRGTYLTNGTLTFDLPNYSTIDFHGAIVSSVSATIAVIIGSTTTNTFGLRVNGLNVSRTAVDTTSGSIGIHLLNLSFSNIDIKKSTGFGTGILANGTQANGGFSYNHIFLSFLHDNVVNLQLSASGVGYCNENTFYGGSFNHSSGYPAVATVNLEVSHFAASPLNNNRFMFPSFEDTGAVAIRRAANIQGTSNMIFYPRMENPTDQANYLISLGSNSINCVIEANSFQVVSTNILDSGTGNNVKTKTGMSYKVATPAGGIGVLSLQSYATSSARVLQARDSAGVERAKIFGDGTIQGLTLVLDTVPTQTTSPAAGGAGALPATPSGYIILAINAQTMKIPFYL